MVSIRIISTEVHYITTFYKFMKKSVHSQLTNDHYHPLQSSKADHILIFERYVSGKQSKRYLSQG